MRISRWVHKLIFKPTLIFCGFVLLLLSGLFIFESSVATDAIFLKEDYQIKEIVLQNLTDIENSGETISDELNEQVQHFNFLISNLYIASVPTLDSNRNNPLNKSKTTPQKISVGLKISLCTHLLIPIFTSPILLLND